MNTLWIDGVGGYGLWEASSIELGRAVDPDRGLSILGDLPSRALALPIVAMIGCWNRSVEHSETTSFWKRRLCFKTVID